MYVPNVHIMNSVLVEEDVMNRNYCIFKNGKLQRKDNNIRVVTEDKIKKDIPCETVSDLFAFGEINLNTRL